MARIRQRIKPLLYWSTVNRLALALVLSGFVWLMVAGITQSS